MTTPRRHPAVLLRHDTPDGTTHHDWLLSDPRTADAPDAPLWTARVTPASREWSNLKQLDLIPLPPHRRIYLTHQGPLAPAPDGSPRGSVTRIDEGDFTAIEWDDEHFVIQLRFRDFTGTIEARHASRALWVARVMTGEGLRLEA